MKHIVLFLYKTTGVPAKILGCRAASTDFQLHASDTCADGSEEAGMCVVLTAQIALPNELTEP